MCYVHEYQKEYRVLVARRPDQQQLDAWRRGVVLQDGYKTAPAEVRFESAQGKGAWVRVIMGEGRKRQIRETCRQLGLPIVRIVRIRIGSLRLGNLKPRQWRYLTVQEVSGLKGKPETVSPLVSIGRENAAYSSIRPGGQPGHRSTSGARKDRKHKEKRR